VDVLRGATRDALKNLVSLAIQEEVSFVLLTGDLYDGDWKDYQTGLFFIQQMGRLQKIGISVYLIYGNHDAQSRITKGLRLPDNVHVFSTRSPETKTIETLGVAIHGQGFQKQSVFDNLSENYPDSMPGYFNIGLLHTALSGAEGHEPYAPCTLGTLQSKGYDVWALGHVHARAVLGDEPLVLFPGNLQGRHARETGPKGCTLVMVADGRVVSQEHRDLHVVRWERLRVDAHALSDPIEVVDAITDAVLEEAGKGGDEVIAVRIIVEGRCGAHSQLLSDPEKWESEIRSSVATATGERAWVEKIRFETEAEVVPVEEKPPGEVLSDLVRYVDSLSANDEFTKNLEDEVKVLREKLPADIFLGEGALEYGSPVPVARLIADVKGMLIPRLTASGLKK
jgi:DNA repair exonuclease SbcCD nuclease subunit